MSVQLCYKERMIIKMKPYPYGCNILNIPKGMVCLYRALDNGGIEDHKKKHAFSILSGKRTKARYYEVPASIQLAERSEQSVDKEIITVDLSIEPASVRSQESTINKILSATTSASNVNLIGLVNESRAEVSSENDADFTLQDHDYFAHSQEPGENEIRSESVPIVEMAGLEDESEAEGINKTDIDEDFIPQNHDDLRSFVYSQEPAINEMIYDLASATNLDSISLINESRAEFSSKNDADFTLQDHDYFAPFVHSQEPGENEISSESVPIVEMAGLEDESEAEGINKTDIDEDFIPQNHDDLRNFVDSQEPAISEIVSLENDVNLNTILPNSTPPMLPWESTVDGFLSTPSYANSPEPIFTPIKDLTPNVSSIPYYTPEESIDKSFDNGDKTSRKKQSKLSVNDTPKEKKIRDNSTKSHKKGVPSSKEKAVRIVNKSSKGHDKNDKLLKQKKFRTDISKPKSITSIKRDNIDKKSKAHSKVVTKTECPTTEKRLKVQMELHELLVIKQMQECPDVERDAMGKSEKLMEIFIAEIEKQLFDKFTSSLQYMMAYRNLNKILQRSTYRERISKGTIDANVIMQLLIDHKSKEGDIKVNQRKAKKKNLEKNDAFNIFDLIECKNTTATSGCDVSVLRTSSLQGNMVEEMNCGVLRMASFPDTYTIPEEIKALVKGEQGAANFMEILLKLAPMRARKSTESYCLSFATKLFFEEEETQSKKFDRYHIDNMRIEHFNHDKFRFKIDEQISWLGNGKLNKDQMFNYFTLHPNCPKKKTTFLGQRVRLRDDTHFYLQLVTDNESLNEMKHSATKNSYNIRFHENRTTFLSQHLALDYMKKHNLVDCLINNELYERNMVEKPISIESHYFRGEHAQTLNEEQKSAVMNIVERSNGELPYILDGPPGTGKTHVLVAAIEEIIRDDSRRNFVLVCCSSNSACDEIFVRLLPILNYSDVFRLYTVSHDKKKVPNDLLKFTNWEMETNTFILPELKFLYTHRVIICTLAVAGNLVRANDNAIFKPDHYSHIFIDESASTHETMTLIPIAGLCTSPNEIKSSIILAGDAKQLDAVTKSEYAMKMNFNKSLMEQLLEKKLYKRNIDTNKFNQNYITQLVKNYRCHPAILLKPSELFYDGVLEAAAADDGTNWFVGFKDDSLLPSSDFPIVFHSVYGTCEIAGEDNSLFNSTEADMVLEYINVLLTTKKCRHRVTQFDIGVVTPYKMQADIIEERCKMASLNNITIGTAAVLQGQEKPIIIVSTVSVGNVSEFAANFRRINVMLTRAKSLLVVIGHEATIKKNKHWSQIIKYCENNNSTIDGNTPFNKN